MKRRLGLWLTACATLAGCTAELPGAQEEPGSSANTLLQVDVKGVPVRFVELDQGLVFALANSAPGHNPIADEAIQGMSITQMYTHWTGQAAPEVLVAAEQRGLELAKEDIVIPADPELAPDVAPEHDAFVPKAKLSDAEFQDAYCADMQICHLSITNTVEYERRSAWIYGFVNPYRGDVTLQVRVYKVAGGWRNELVSDILEGSETRYTGGGNALVERRTKIKIFNAEGDGYHFSMTW
jgi:hypothetical protein